MSRSYRKPWFKDGYKGSPTKQTEKNYANRAIRRTKQTIPNGMAYKQFSSSYDICDFRWYAPNNTKLKRK